MAHANAHVIEYRARNMNRKIGEVFAAGLPREQENAAIRFHEIAAGFRHGWFFDEMAGANFKNDGGRGIVWVDQPYMD